MTYTNVCSFLSFPHSVLHQTMKLSVLGGLVGVILLGAFKDVEGTVNSYHLKDEQAENPLMEVSRQYPFTGTQQDFALTGFLF